MRKIYLLSICFFVISSVFGQDKLLNSDGTISNYAMRQMFVDSFKGSTDYPSFELESDNLVVITKDNLNNKNIEGDNVQKAVIISCFKQLLEQITVFQKVGYLKLKDIEFKGVIFKTNCIYQLETKRYFFKFSIDELLNFPTYLDFKELYEYVVNNNNKNIILVKNDK
ncbi:hypothetical protein AS361_03905 [Myroides marinus]|uniref:hypothetical protein n=1 Tax=Myroides marinus TaxID=703342 RepID=UPI000741E713|nr:hypothetical protein [Myroides marinus]KUF39001.1 hypothetical protein AS361_03905 [Myroides marinus]